MIGKIEKMMEIFEEQNGIVENNFEDMMKKLDERYGCKIRIIL